jgi:hypothetical protein
VIETRKFFWAMFLTALIAPTLRYSTRDVFEAVLPASPFWQDVFPWLAIALLWIGLYAFIRRARTRQ